MDHPWALCAREAVARNSGRTPVVIPQMGGPTCNEVFTDILGMPAIRIQHSCRGCSQHAPEEHVLLPMCREALAIMAGIYWNLGEREVPHP
jgi:hypothetical protein